MSTMKELCNKQKITSFEGTYTENIHVSFMTWSAKIRLITLTYYSGFSLN